MTIKQQREKKGINRAELSRQTGISPQVLKYYEEHPECDIRAKNLYRIGQVLGFTVEEFFIPNIL